MYIIGEEEVEAVRRVIESRQLFRYRGGEGGETDTFEREWAEKVGTTYATAMASGTGALICGLAGMGVGPGDEVIVPGYTFMATALAVVAVGAVPIIAEVDESLTIDPADIERKVTPRTKAIVPVHMNGLPCNMDAIMDIARRHGLLVLEDACQADGGSYKGKRLGSIGHAGAFSFNQFKIITCGEGGALVTNDQDIYERALMYHDGGCVFRGKDMRNPFFAGSNFRINEILSAILRVQLTRLEDMLAAMRAEKHYLTEQLADESAFRLSPVNDPDGDCSTTVGLLFETAERAERFMVAARDMGVEVDCPLHSGRHVYEHWEPILEKRGGHHPGRDAFRQTDADVQYSRDMCPRTLEYLSRTLFIGTSPTRSREELENLAQVIRRVGREQLTPDSRLQTSRLY